MLEAGALRTLRDHELRSAIMAYYRTAEDDAANVMHVDQYKDRFTEDLLRTGTAVTDNVSLDRIVQFLRQDAALAARVRQVRFRSANQAFFLNRIEGARLALEEKLSQRGGR